MGPLSQCPQVHHFSMPLCARLGHSLNRGHWGAHCSLFFPASHEHEGLVHESMASLRSTWKSARLLASPDFHSSLDVSELPSKKQDSVIVSLEFCLLKMSQIFIQVCIQFM